MEVRPIDLHPCDKGPVRLAEHAETDGEEGTRRGGEGAA
jgi:hypothetical protein